MSFSCLVCAAFPLVAAAHAGDFHGVVLALQASRGQAIIRREALGGIPGETSAYRIERSDLRRLHAGDRLTAVVNERTKPPALSDLHILPAQAAAQSLQTIRRVAIMNEGDRVPQTPFVDQTGRPFTFSKFLGQNVVLAFIYTRCKDARMCPLISAKFGQLQDAFKNSDTHLVEITLDPEYDTPPVLANYAKLFGAKASRWTLGTGDANSVLNFDAQFGIQPFADPSIGLIHTERTVVIDKRGVVRYLIDDPAWSPSGIIAQVDELDHRASNPLARIDLALSRAAVAICGNGVAGFSGLVDLLVFMLILGAFGWGFYRIGRAMFKEG